MTHLSIGDIFDTVDSVKVKVQELCDGNFVDFKVETNNKKYLRFACKHGARLRLRSKGERPNQHYQNFLSCKATIAFYKSQKDDSLKCTKFDNHAVSEQIYNHDKATLTEEEHELSSNLKNGNC